MILWVASKPAGVEWTILLLASMCRPALRLYHWDVKAICSTLQEEAGTSPEVALHAEQLLGNLLHNPTLLPFRPIFLDRCVSMKYCVCMCVQCSSASGSVTNHILWCQRGNGLGFARDTSLNIKPRLRLNIFVAFVFGTQVHG